MPCATRPVPSQPAVRRWLGRLAIALGWALLLGCGSASFRAPARPAPERDALASDAPRLAEIDRVVEAFVEAGAFPGASVVAGRRAEIVHRGAYGRQTYDDDATPVEHDTIYDLASLTKVVVTTTAAMILVDEGRLDLDAAVQTLLPHFDGAARSAITVRDLLTHSSGVDWWAPLYEEARGADEFLDRIYAMELAYPPGTKALYSDLGLILLGEILERAAGEPLDRFAARRIFEPLDMSDTTYNPGAALRSRIAPTELDSGWRNRLLHGEVHDENAAALGGVAPHAGLFSTAGDLARFAQMILDGGVYGGCRIVSAGALAEFTRVAALVPGSSRGLGWDTKSPRGSSAGELFSPRSFGHTGFTGTSIWIDPERELFLIVLTNRVHPTRENRQIREARPKIADALVRALEPEARPPVSTGLGRIAAGEASLATEGGTPVRRIGLVAHAASVTRTGEHAIEVLSDAGHEIARIFAPEHGLRGEAAAGEAIADGRDAASGVPVVSLYGEARAPGLDDLADLDALVFDLQGAGVRFYTYVSTLLLSLDAAADAGVPLIVLDRPNPLGGLRIEGPTSAPRSSVPTSFVNLAPGPLVHGLTLGEMARYANSERRASERADLRVVPMRGWKRTMTWRDTGLPWIPPSPNLRTPEAALAYPGVALLEASNLSEGRGTPTPFLRVGAPWLQPDELNRIEVPGFRLIAETFTPRGAPSAPNPKHDGTECRGFRVVVTDPAAAEGYRLGLELLTALSGHPDFSWLGEGAALTRLLGTPRVHEALTAGRAIDVTLSEDEVDHERWRQERNPALIY